MRTTTSSVSAETRGALEPQGSPPGPACRRPRRGSVRVLIAAAEVLVVVGVTAASWLISRDRSDSDDAEGPVAPVEPSHLMLDMPGWELTSFADSDMRAWGDPTAVFVDPAKGVTGPKLVATVLQTGTANVLDAPEQSVQIGAVMGRLYVDGDNTLVHWVGPSGTTFELYGWRIDTDDVVEVAATMTVGADGQPTTTALPDNVVRADSELEALLSRYVQYVWNGPESQVVDLVLTARGGPTQRDADESCCDEGEARITLRDEPATFVFYSPGLYRVDQIRGFWEWEIGAEFPRAMRELVSTLTAPPGFSTATIPNDGTLPTRSAIAYTLAFNAACTWIDQLETARQISDEPTANAAAHAISEIATWTELDGIPDVDPLTPGRPTRLGLLRTAAAALEGSTTTPADARIAIRCA